MKKFLTILFTAVLVLSCNAQQPTNEAVEKFATENNLSSADKNTLNAAVLKVEAAGEGMKVLAEEYNTADEARREAIIAEYEAKQGEMKEYILTVIRENRENLIPAFFIPQLMYDLSVEELNEFCAEGTAYYDAPSMRQPKALLEGLRKRAPGMMFTDLEEPDLKGEMHKLSEYVGRGNYVLVDFWASWCGPCRAEMPNVKAAYEKYHAKGFEVVGLSFDQKKEAWEKAVKDMELNWIHLSDLKGWQTIAGEVYGVKSIPESILVGPDGVIVAQGLRGAALEEKLAEIYGE